MRMILFFCLTAVMLAATPRAVAADGAQIEVRALLVIASNQRAESDARLAAYEPTLRRILRFESYRLAGERSARLSGKTSVTLARGHSLDLETEPSDGKGVRLRVRWQEGGRSHMNTALVLRPGVPAVLGGPSTGKEGEVWAVILVAE